MQTVPLPDVTNPHITAGSTWTSIDWDNLLGVGNYVVLWQNVTPSIPMDEIAEYIDDSLFTLTEGLSGQMYRSAIRGARAGRYQGRGRGRVDHDAGTVPLARSAAENSGPRTSHGGG